MAPKIVYLHKTAILAAVDPDPMAFVAVHSILLVWKDQSTFGMVKLEESSESRTTPSSDQENELAGGLLSLLQKTVSDDPSSTGSSGRMTVTSGRAKNGWLVEDL